MPAFFLCFYVVVVGSIITSDASANHLGASYSNPSCKHIGANEHSMMNHSLFAGGQNARSPSSGASQQARSHQCPASSRGKGARHPGLQARLPIISDPSDHKSRQAPHHKLDKCSKPMRCHPLTAVCTLLCSCIAVLLWLSVLLMHMMCI